MTRHLHSALRILLPALFIFGIFCGYGHAIYGQAVSADVSGIVKDQSGAVVQAARIRVVNVQTNAAETTVTATDGSYHVRGLQPGSYEVVAEAGGFKRLVRSGITLSVAQSLELNLDLAMGSTSESVNVTAEATQLETTSGQVSSLVNRETLNELPLNGRDLFGLTLLQPGVVPTTNANASPFSMGTWFKGAIQGTRPSMFNVTSDGADINDPGFNTPPGGPVGVQLGVEATEEFRVITNPYNAENGRNGGGQVQYVTRSGTNFIHGSVYEFIRNSALDARNHFDVAQIPHFVRNQFGASIGGPLMKNKLFYFANYEGLREIQGITDNSVVVPNANAKAGYLPSKADPTKLIFVGVNPIAQQYLNLYIAPNGTDLGNGTAYWNGSGKEIATENYGIIRVDYTLSDKDQFFVRNAVDNGSLINPFGATKVPGFPLSIPNLASYNQVSWQHLLTAHQLNQLKLNYNLTNYISNPVTIVKSTSGQPLTIATDPTNPYLGTSAVTGMANVGYGNTSPLGSFSNNFEIIDNYSWDIGHHTFKFGGDLKYVQNAGPFPYGENASYAFSSAGLKQTAVSNNSALESLLLGQPYTWVGNNAQIGNSNRYWRQKYTGLYGQDDWKLSPRLTVNVGMRYEVSTNPRDKYNRQGNIMNYLTAPALVFDSNQIFQYMPKDLFSPRVGFAWKPFGEKTSLRGGYGIMRDQLWENLYGDTRLYGPYYQLVQSNNPNYVTSPTSLAAVGGTQQNVGSFGVTWTPKFPYYHEYSLTAERQVTDNILFTLGYAGSKGIHLPRTGEQNPFIPSRGVRLNNNFGSVPLVVTDSTSNYNALEAMLKQRLSKGLMYQVSYTWSHSLDTASGPYTSDYGSAPGVTQDFFNLRGDYGPSDIDRRNVLVANFVYELPFGSGKSFGSGAPAIAQKLIGNWQWSGILSLESGPTYTAVTGSFNNSGINGNGSEAERPNMVTPGTNQCQNTGNPNAWIITSMYALSPQNTYGNSSRNGGCGPALRNFDTSFTKRTKFTERMSMEFRAEMFNIFNLTNYAEPTNTLYTGRVSGCTTGNACGIPSPTAGKITATVTTSRQIQFAAKILF